MVDIDPADPGALARAAAEFSDRGRWGEEDVRGTVNVRTEEERIAGARLVRRGAAFSPAQLFAADGRGWRRRTHPVQTVLDTGEQGSGSPINPIAVK
ncbi:hypothetical protein [Saccharopolyspora hordei]|uniref:Uncharacterized protein n=1 Tax=Saccharopolyspora hordei TaxID=1838 RepID=A0A853ARI8_9PSEU|nr:hypothetical protein [Saccharopolyspora hordei]NYI83961.1 hypothetical protein [Saccharopolyspora hordei]